MKKRLIVLGVIGFLATAGVAFAENNSNNGDTHVSTTSHATSTPAMILQVGPRGQVVLRGTIDSIGANSLTVKSWGGDWTVNVSTSSEVLPKGLGLSSFHVGEFVGVQGTINMSSSWTIDAKTVRDWTEQTTVNHEIKQNKQDVTHEMKSNMPRNLEGTVSNLDASAKTFMLAAKGGVNYSVTLTSSAQILQKNWLTLDFTKVKDGDTVRVWGLVASSTISASILRDFSI